jgi:hypothetical protein
MSSISTCGGSLSASIASVQTRPAERTKTLEQFIDTSQESADRSVSPSELKAFTDVVADAASTDSQDEKSTTLYGQLRQQLLHASSKHETKPVEPKTDRAQDSPVSSPSK